jgi:aryl-alcohol dehydrogenase-like predicted oxidoreductase
MELPKRQFGRTGLEVTQLGFGAMELRGTRIWKGRPCSDEQAQIVLNAVLDAGINFIDTANDYGMSEMYIGRHIADRRAEFIVATKCGCNVSYGGKDTDGTPHVWTKENLYRNAADSLLKMQTNHVDVMLLHNPAVEVAEENNLVEVLQELKDQGAFSFMGCSSTSPHLATYIDWGVFDAFEIPYSALERQHEDLITRAGEAGAGVIIRGGVARGEPGEGLGGEEKWETWEKARLDELLEDGETRTSFMLRFTISHPHCHTTIVGTQNLDHLKENVEAACRGPLDSGVYEEARRRLSEAGERPE